MKPPTLPLGEELRLSTLQRYDILDTVPEQAFEDLTALALHICGAPVALVSLVDRHRQWFKSKLGVSFDETARNISFCGHAILQPDLFIVPDATKDERFADNPLVTGESQVRFYAGAPLISPDGQAIGTLCIMDHVPRELTARQQDALRMLARQVMSQLELRRQTRELAEQEARLHIMTENARVGLIIIDRERRYLYASDAYAEIVGSSVSAIVGKRVPDILAPIYEDYIRPRMDQAFAGERVSFEIYRPHSSGERFYAATYEPRKVGSEVLFVVGVITDITARKLAEVALADSQARLDFALQTSRIGAWEINLEDHTTHRTLLHDQIFGYTSLLPDWTYQSFLGHVLPEDRPAVDESFRQATAKQTDWSFECRIRRTDGEVRWIWAAGGHKNSNGGKLARLAGVVQDITERKQTEEALRQSQLSLRDAEERWQFAVLAADMGVWDWNMETNVVYHSDRWCTMLGYEPGEITDQLGEWSHRMHPQDLELTMFRLREHIEGRVALYQSEHRMRTKDGTYRWIQDRGKVMARDATGRPLRMVGTHSDITPKKNAEEAAQRLVAIVESSDDAIIGKDLTGTILTWNNGAEKVFGYSASEMVGKSILFLIPEERKAEEDYILGQIKIGQSVQHFETQRRTKTGALIDVSVTASPIRDMLGRIIGASKVARDISARKRVEARVAWMASFPENNPSSVLELELQTGVFHYLNPATLAQFPTLQAEGLNHPLVAGLPALKSELALKQTLQRELFVGDRCYSQMLTYAVASDRVRAYSSDITARKQAEHALQIQQEHSQALLLLSRKLEHVENYTEILHAARAAIESILGFHRIWFYQLTADQQYLKLIFADDGQNEPAETGIGTLLTIKGDGMLEEIAACSDIVVVADARTDPRTNKEIVNQLGNRTIVNVPVWLAGKKIGAIGTGTFGEEGIRPISSSEQEFLSSLASHVAAVIDRVTASEARLKAELELRASEERLRTVTNTAQVGLVIVDQSHCYRYANPAYARILHLPTPDIVGQRVADVLPAIYSGQIAPRLARAFAGERVEYELTVPANSLTSPRHYAVIYEPGTDQADRVVVVVIVDISERKQAEISLRESQERFREIAENIQEVFWMTDPAKNQMLYISPAYEEIWGRTCQSLFDSPWTWLEAIHPDDRPRVLLAAQTKQMQGDYDETYRIQRPDGAERWIHDRAFPIRDTAGKVIRVVGTALDITAQRNLELQFRQAQKMEAIGQLAGGVAHDFNNILAAIMMQTEMTILAEDLPEEARDGLREIRTSSERAANLTRQLLLFSRKQVMHTSELDLNEAVSSLFKMLQRIIGEHLSLHYNFHSGTLFVRADAGMLDQVVMNLVVNARDAMPNGGCITIETSLKHLSNIAAADIPELSPGTYACLQVSDTGCGIAPENLTRIFEPFFTTKGPGKGTGLGLATVFGIVKQHGGTILVESKVGQGTTFKILLPVAETKPETINRSAVKPLPRGGSETILLVEDDSSVRVLSRILLERSGYKVLEAADGNQALKLGQQHQESIRLLLTDIVMPGGLSGRELADQLQARNPKLKVILTSGYSADMAGRELTLQAGQKFIQKPAPPHHLLEAIRQSLDQ